MDSGGNPQQRHRVVIVGAGFGGVRAAKALEGGPAQITLIDRTNHHLFQPLLYQVATGVLSAGQIAPALPGMFRHQKNVEVVLGDVEDVDIERRSCARSPPTRSTSRTTR
jgi:NADH:ubiquinone reductase (H+-translocating)